MVGWGMFISDPYPNNYITPERPSHPVSGDILIRYEGGSKIHEHPHSTELQETIAQYALEPAESRPWTWDEFATKISESFPELDIDGDYLKQWAYRNIAKLSQGMPQKVAENTLEADESLDQAEKFFELAHKAEQRADDLLDQDDPPDQTIQRYMKRAAELREKALNELERWQLVPPEERAVEVKEANFTQINTGETMEHMMGPTRDVSGHSEPA